MNKKQVLCMLIIVLVFIVVAGSAFLIVQKSITSETSNAKLFAHFFGKGSSTETSSVATDQSLATLAAASMQISPHDAEAASISPQDSVILADELQTIQQILFQIQSRIIATSTP